MHKAKIFGMLALALAAGVAACDRSGDADETRATVSLQDLIGDDEEMSPETRETIMRLQMIQYELEPIQEAALQDEALAARLAALQLRIETLMREEDSDLFARLDGYEERVKAAEAAGDMAQIHALTMEAQRGLQREIRALQTSIIERPEIRAEIEAYEAAQRAAMIQIDPKAESLLDSLEELMASLPQ